MLTVIVSVLSSGMLIVPASGFRLRASGIVAWRTLTVRQAPLTKGALYEARSPTPPKSVARSLLELSFHQLAQDVQQRPVHLLRAGCIGLWDVHVNVRRAAERAAIVPRETDGREARFTRGCDTGQNVPGQAARRNPDGHVTGPPQRLDLPREHAVEAVVVGDGGQNARIRRQRDCPN